MVKAVASQDLWFWHAYCRPPGSLNNINLLQQSPIYLAERNRVAHKCPYQMNEHAYKRGYYLTEEIYPTWPTCMKMLPYHVDPNKKKFKKLKEGARKDVERAFGVLKGKWGILRRLMRAMTVNKIINEMYTCMILHNMILKDEGHAFSPVHIRDPVVERIFDDTVLVELMDSDMHYDIEMIFSTILQLKIYRTSRRKTLSSVR
ncbi:uncharacterized protein LOC110931408 [Helianthus annuus]|uniref:uncharacterized protein LOC110931408 n=1 Tax=Helianthus annuus TaxID=4232 RepID=UPI000B905808|nr:uncharacterized protein LOC110931408 [Helianthus annuus]